MPAQTPALPQVHQTYDFGAVNAPTTGNMSVSLTHAPAWRTLLRESRVLIARGEDGRLALNHLRPSADSKDPVIRANATLQKDEWIQYDDAVTAAYLEMLTGVSDLLGAGLRLNISNPFGTTVLEAEKISEMSAAQVSMYAGTPPQDDRVAYNLWGVPVPIISKGFWLDERVLEASRMRGQSLDVSNADAATRVVAEKLESLLFNGGVVYGGYSLYGYTTHPDINTGSLTGSWLTLSTTSPGSIVNDIITMKQALTNDNAMGPYMLYVPRLWIDSLDRSYFEITPTASPGVATTAAVAPTQTIRQKIMALSEIRDVRPTSQLTTGVVLVSMTRPTIDVGFGFEPRLIQWESQGGMVNHFRVMSIMTFRVKSDYNGRSGVAYYTV